MSNLSSDVIIGVSIILAFCVCWAFLMWAIKDQQSVMNTFFSNGGALRMLSVIFIAVISGYLVTIDRLSEELLATLYSGIAGYVLGGIEKPVAQDKNIDKSVSQDSDEKIK